METTRHLLETIIDMTKCAVCDNTMADPTALPCVHTFCFECLNQCWKDELPENKVSCRQCQNEFSIPSGGIAELPKNFFIQQLIEVQKSQTMSMAGKCDICLKSHIEKNAEIICIECNKNLCNHCVGTHMRETSTKEHRIVSMNKITDITQLLSKKQFCNQHREKELEVYCNECKVVVCPACFIDNHNKHDSSNVANVVKELKKHIEKDVNEITNLSAGIGNELRRLDEYFEHCSETITTVETKIREQGEELKNIVDQHVRELLHRLNTEKLNIQKDMEAVKEKLFLQKISLESFKNYAEEVLKNANISYVAGAAESMNNAADDLKQMDVVNVEQSYAEVRFDKSDLEQFKADQEWLIGKLSVVNNIFQRATVKKPSTYAQDAKLATTFQFQSAVRGIVVVKDEVFVVCENSKEVRVYDAVKLKHRTTFVVKGMCDPWSIAATDRALFISENKSAKIDRIYRIELRNVENRTKLTADGVSNKRLSITEQNNIIVSCSPPLTSGNTPCKICEYKQYTSVYAPLHRQIVLPPELRGLKLVIQAENDRFLLSHTDTANKIHRLCLIDNTGKVIDSYGGVPGSNKGHLDDPRDIAVDRNGYILVPCYNSGKVVLLNSKLRFVKDVSIPKSANIGAINAICLDECRGRLFVSDEGRKTISVFQFGNSVPGHKK